MTTRIGLSGAEVTVPDPVVDPDYEESPELLARIMRSRPSCWPGRRERWMVHCKPATLAARCVGG